VSDLHIDDFYKDAALILVNLYQQFPRKTMLLVEDVAGQDSPDEFGLHSPRHIACLETMLWLASYDYLAYDQLVRQDAIDQAVLSHKAFIMLNSPLPITPLEYAHRHKEDSPEPNQSPRQNLVIHRLRNELKHGTSDSLSELMKLAMHSMQPSS